MMKGYVWIAAAALLAACGSGSGDVDASGVFEATEVVVSAQTAGEILSFDIEEGLSVGEGEVVGLIDTLSASLLRQQLEAQASSTRSRVLDEARQVASLEQQLANLRIEEARYSALVADGAAPQKSLDDICQKIRVAEREIEAAREKLSTQNESLDRQTESIRAQVGQVDEQIRNSLIVCPIEGVVLQKYAERGEYAQPGRALFLVGDVMRLRLRAYVTAPQLDGLALGQTCTVLVDDGEGGSREYGGTITWIADRAEFTPKTIQTRDERENLVYAVKIDVENDGLIKRGMYGDVRF